MRFFLTYSTYYIVTSILKEDLQNAEGSWRKI